jgi:hypothetical protein
MSAAFTREESAETAADVELPDRPTSPHPNLVTASGLEALTKAMRDSRTAYDAAQRIEDVSERRRAIAVAAREVRFSPTVSGQLSSFRRRRSSTRWLSGTG